MGVTHMGGYHMKMIALILFLMPLIAIEKEHLLYKISGRLVDDIIKDYKQYTLHHGHDFSLLRQVAHIVIESGLQESDLDSQILSLYGISLSNPSLFIKELRKATKSNELPVQLITLQLLAKSPEDSAEELLLSATNSRFLQIQVEALYHSVMRRVQDATSIIEAISNKLPKHLKEMFIDLYAIDSSKMATNQLKSFLGNEEIRIRKIAISAVAKWRRDDLIESVRRSLYHTNPIIKEASASTLGELKDLEAIPKLRKLSSHPNTNVKIASLLALSRIGDEDAKLSLIEISKENNLFAINACSEIDNSEAELLALLSSTSPTIRLNAAISLLAKKHPASLKEIIKILDSGDDVTIYPMFSNGSTLMYWKYIPSNKHLSSDERNKAIRASYEIKEHLLSLCVDLPQAHFLKIANKLLTNNCKSLIPKLIMLMESVRSKEVIELLRNKSNQLGSPLVRAYALLGLYRMDEHKYNDEFFRWIEKQSPDQLIDIKLPQENKIVATSKYELTPNETSGLIISALGAMVNKHDPRALDMVLKMMSQGNKKNKYALAGLLLRVID